METKEILELIDAKIKLANTLVKKNGTVWLSSLTILESLREDIINNSKENN